MARTANPNKIARTTVSISLPTNIAEAFKDAKWDLRRELPDYGTEAVLDFLAKHGIVVSDAAPVAE